MERTFTFVVERDPESGWLVAEVVELPGCYTQAPDLASLEANVKEAITAYLETAGADDIESPEFVGTWKIQIAA